MTQAQLDALISALTSKLRDVQMRENAGVVNAVETYRDAVREMGKRVSRLERRLDSPVCPSCGRERGK